MINECEKKSTNRMYPPPPRTCTNIYTHLHPLPCLFHSFFQVCTQYQNNELWGNIWTSLVLISTGMHCLGPVHFCNGDMGLIMPLERPGMNSRGWVCTLLCVCTCKGFWENLSFSLSVCLFSLQLSWSCTSKSHHFLTCCSFMFWFTTFTTFIPPAMITGRMYCLLFIVSVHIW